MTTQWATSPIIHLLKICERYLNVSTHLYHPANETQLKRTDGKGQNGMVINKANDGEKHKDKEIQIKRELAERRGSICTYIYIYTYMGERQKG